MCITPGQDVSFLLAVFAKGEFLDVVVVQQPAPEIDVAHPAREGIGEDVQHGVLPLPQDGRPPALDDVVFLNVPGGAHGSVDPQVDGA